MTLIVLSEVEICQRYNVTPAQLVKASRQVDGKTGEIFYRVASQSIDATYTVRAVEGSRGMLFTCTCPAGNPDRDKYGMPLGPIIPCWHKRAARAAAFAHYQAENLQARREAEEAAARAILPLNGNQAFSLTKKGPAQVVKGFDIRIQRVGSSWMNEQAHAWAPAGALPAEWTALTNDPTVVSAVLFPSTQRTWRADRRKLVASFTREAVAV